MRKLTRQVFACYCFILLASCSQLKTNPSVQDESNTWNAKGKASIRYYVDGKKKSHQFRFNWSKFDRHHSIQLSSTLGMGNVAVTGRNNDITIRRGNKVLVSQQPFQAYSQQVLGIDISLDDLAEILEGKNAAQAPAFETTIDGWQVSYKFPDSIRDQQNKEPPRPSNINATKGDNTLRIVISEWQAARQ